MTLLDGTVVNVALHTVGEDLDATLAELQWITNGYLLTMSALILLGGSLGDRYGRRRVFVVGTVWFAIAHRTAHPEEERLECQGHLIQFDGNRDAVRRQAVEYALNLLRSLLLQPA